MPNPLNLELDRIDAQQFQQEGYKKLEADGNPVPLTFEEYKNRLETKRQETGKTVEQIQHEIDTHRTTIEKYLQNTSTEAIKLIPIEQQNILSLIQVDFGGTNFKVVHLPEPLNKDFVVCQAPVGIEGYKREVVCPLDQFNGFLDQAEQYYKDTFVLAQEQQQEELDFVTSVKAMEQQLNQAVTGQAEEQTYDDAMVHMLESMDQFFSGMDQMEANIAGKMNNKYLKGIIPIVQGLAKFGKGIGMFFKKAFLPLFTSVAGVFGLEKAVARAEQMITQDGTMSDAETISSTEITTAVVTETPDGYDQHLDLDLETGIVPSSIASEPVQTLSEQFTITESINATALETALQQKNTNQLVTLLTPYFDQVATHYQIPSHVLILDFLLNAENSITLATKCPAIKVNPADRLGKYTKVNLSGTDVTYAAFDNREFGLLFQGLHTKNDFESAKFEKTGDPDQLRYDYMMTVNQDKKTELTELYIKYFPDRIPITIPEENIETQEEFKN